MAFAHLVKATPRTKRWGVFLLCLTVLAGACSNPPPSPEAQALKKEVLEEIKNLTSQLIDPLSTEQDWESLRPMLQSSYEIMQAKGKLLPLEIVVLDGDGITRVRFPSEYIRHYNFSKYQPAQAAFTEKRNAQGALYFKGEKIFIIFAPLLQKDKVIGAVGFSFPEDQVRKQWNVSEEDFLKLDFNQ